MPLNLANICDPVMIILILIFCALASLCKIYKLLLGMNIILRFSLLPRLQYRNNNKAE